MIHHYYHLYADGSFEEPLSEHIEAIEKITDPIEVKVGLVGSPINLDRAANLLPEPWKVCALANQGWEQVTLKALHRDAPELDGPVLYAHTKGAANNTPLNRSWRECMTRNLIDAWQYALYEIRQPETDLVGVHWLTPEKYPRVAEEGNTPYFGGNFWWADPDYLRTLPEPGNNLRWDAEEWVGQNDPNVIDLRPGWPGNNCHTH